MKYQVKWLFAVIIIFGGVLGDIWALGINNMMAGEETAKDDPIMESGIVFTATLDSVVEGPTAQSYPPIYNNTLTFTVKEVFRGNVKPDQKLTANHQARQHQAPEFPNDKLFLVAVSDVQGSYSIDDIQVATVKLIEKARIVGRLPLGWSITDKGTVSPWAEMGKGYWPEDAAGYPNKDRMVCVKTGRPALFVWNEIEFSVEPVPPVKEIQWTNPDGDGVYKVTVKNTSTENRVVGALLTDGKKILWNESVAVLCQGKAQPAKPLLNKIPSSVTPAVLKPGESVSGQINVFTLKGIEWPRGGYRIEFMFCLGKKSVKQSFYYMSSYHDAIREKVLAE